MAVVFTKLRRKNKEGRGSGYSTVSTSDLTPGSVEVWVELPDEIKFDPSLAPFQKLYEKQHGNAATIANNISEDGDKTRLTNNETEVKEIAKQIDNPSKQIGNREIECTTSKEEISLKSPKHKKLYLFLRVVKLIALVGCWLLLTVSLIMNREKTDVVLHTAVTGGEVKEYILQSSLERLLVSLKVTGPFNQVPPPVQDNANVMKLWIHRQSEILGIDQNSTEWLINLQPEDRTDFAPSVTLSRILTLEQNLRFENLSDVTNTSIFDTSWLGNFTKVSLRMCHGGNITVPLTISYRFNPWNEKEGLMYSVILLLTLYFLIIFEVVNRTLAALLSASLSIAVLALSGARPTLTELVSWLDMETLLLLFSMMILVAILAETGLFDYLAVVAFEITGGHTWPLINCLCFFTAFFSTFLDNVTTVLLMTPVTIRLCEVMHLDPIPVLMSMVIFSNVGGAITPVGDPPNVIIASHPSVLKQNINFTSFTLHMGVGILLVCVQTYAQLRFMFRDMSKLRHSVPMDILELRQEIGVWRRAAASLSSYSKDEDLVRKALEKKVKKLKTTLEKWEAGGGSSKKDPKFCLTLADMKAKYAIRDKQLLIKASVCIVFVVVVFFLHAIPELQRLSLGWTALLGALLLLLLAEREDLEPILARVEWSTLLFFAALFVLMEALSKLGLIAWIGKITEAVILTVDQESRLAVSIMLVLWVSGIASAFVDNIPLTTMMVRVMSSLASPSGLALPLTPLVWALSFGACLGGNGTLIGASANVVCAGVAEQHGYRFTFVQYLRVGFPVMLGNLVVASAYLAFCHVLLAWH